jgi:DNA-dependent protein kinase catalytic subunit
LACFSISSYIIGVGDRHLENFLLDLSSGRLIGIDFGHAFGSATQYISVPELMPFRLTKQLTNFLLPLDTDGLLKHNMIHTLRGTLTCFSLELSQLSACLLEYSNSFSFSPW